jgi:hypothetical protein
MTGNRRHLRQQVRAIRRRDVFRVRRYGPARELQRSARPLGASLRATRDTVIPGSSVSRTIANFWAADQRRRRSVPYTLTSLLFGLVIETTRCLPLRIRDKSCPEIQEAISPGPPTIPAQISRLRSLHARNFGVSLGNAFGPISSCTGCRIRRKLDIKFPWQYRGL